MHNSEENSYPSKREIIDLMEKLKIKMENGELSKTEMGILLEDLKYFVTKQNMLIDAETLGCIVTGWWVRQMMTC